MRTIIYTCDKCGATGTQNRSPNAAEYLQFWNIKLGYNAEPSPAEIPTYEQPKAQWCRLCMEKLGLLGDSRQKEAKASAPYQETTLEDIIRAIIADEVHNQLNDRGVGQ